MATTKQKRAAKKNIKKAARVAKKKRTVAKLPKNVRMALGKEGGKAEEEGLSIKDADALFARTNSELYT